MKRTKVLMIITILIMQLIFPILSAGVGNSKALAKENTIIKQDLESTKLESIKDEKVYSQAYLDWLELSEEEKLEVIEPRSEYIGMSVLDNMVSDNANLPNKYDLRDDIDITVENQGAKNTCYAFATLNAIETNIALKTGEEYDFSELHVEYMTSKLLGGNRTYNGGGNFQNVIDYTKGMQGPVLESEIPYSGFYSSENYYVLRDANPIITATETIEFPTIEKNEEYTESEMTDFKNSVKSHIMKNGALYTIMYMEEAENYYDSFSYGYCCLNGEMQANHAVTIIGWDDTYSKDNFPSENRPTKDGAWLVLNSYGTSFGNKGIFYISYEDVWVNNNISGIVETEKFIDTFGPSVTIKQNSTTDGSVSMTVDVVDIGGNEVDLDSLKYQWTRNLNVPSKESFFEGFTNGDTLTKAGTGYLWVLASDKLGNETIISSNEWDISGIGYKIVTAKLDEKGTLTVSGSSFMDDYNKIVFNINTPWFIQRKNIKNIIFEEGIKNIGLYAFCGCENISSVTIPSSVDVIQGAAFGDCTNLKEVKILNGTAVIGGQAFAYCDNLEKVIIPKSVEVFQDESVFVNSPNVTIYCKSNSEAETYAKTNNIKYVLLGDSYKQKEIEGKKYLFLTKPMTKIEMISELEISGDKKVFSKGTNTEIENSKKIATGMTIKIENNNNTTEYIIILKGDINADGNADLNDILLLNKYRLNKTTLDKLSLKAADVDENGKADLNDILKVNKYRLGKITNL